MSWLRASLQSTSEYQKAKTFVYVFGMGLLFVLFSCGEDQNGSKNRPPAEGSYDSGGKTKNGKSSSAASSGGTGEINVESLVPSGTPLLEATFQLSAKAAGIPICDGTVTMKINAAIGKSSNVSLFELPQSEVDCALIGKINLKPIVGMFSDSSALPKPIVEENVLFFDRIGSSTYTPPRPFLPSFLASSRENLQSLNLKRQVTVQDGKRNQSGSGTMTIKMLEFGRNYRSDQLSRNFPDSFTFEITNQGFENIDKTSNILFDRIAISMSLNPVSILALTFSGDAQSIKQTATNNPDVVSGPFGQLITVLPNANSGGIGGLFGTLIDSIAKIIKVDLQLVLKEQKGLSPGVETPVGDDDGVQIGK